MKQLFLGTVCLLFLLPSLDAQKIVIVPFARTTPETLTDKIRKKRKAERSDLYNQVSPQVSAKLASELATTYEVVLLPENDSLVTSLLKRRRLKPVKDKFMSKYFSLVPSTAVNQTLRRIQEANDGDFLLVLNKYEITSFSTAPTPYGGGSKNIFHNVHYNLFDGQMKLVSGTKVSKRLNTMKVEKMEKPIRKLSEKFKVKFVELLSDLQ